eukprot:1153343-Pelagomonas_calceolata.AAC.7
MAAVLGVLCPCRERACQACEMVAAAAACKTQVCKMQGLCAACNTAAAASNTHVWFCAVCNWDVVWSFVACNTGAAACEAQVCKTQGLCDQRSRFVGLSCVWPATRQQQCAKQRSVCGLQHGSSSALNKDLCVACNKGGQSVRWAVHVPVKTSALDCT